MGAAADFAAVVTHCINLYTFAVFIAEQADRAARTRFGNGHFFAGNVNTGINCFVDKFFDLAQLLGSHFTREGEVKAQTFGRDVRAALCNGLIKNLAQCCLKQMRRSVQFCRFVGCFRKAAFELMLRARFGLLLVLFECRTEPLNINGEAVFARHFLGELNGETECVEQAERILSVNYTVFKLAFDALKFAHTVGESALESCLLRVKFANDSGFVFAQFGIDLAVIRNNGFGNFAE